MNRASFGRLAIILGGLVLSLQIYGLKFIQGVDIKTGSWNTHVVDYATGTPILQALLITLAIIIYGIVLVIRSYKRKE